MEKAVAKKLTAYLPLLSITTRMYLSSNFTLLKIIDNNGRQELTITFLSSNCCKLSSSFNF